MIIWIVSSFSNFSIQRTIYKLNRTAYDEIPRLTYPLVILNQLLTMQNKMILWVQWKDHWCRPCSQQSACNKMINFPWGTSKKNKPCAQEVDLCWWHNWCTSAVCIHKGPSSFHTSLCDSILKSAHSLTQFDDHKLLQKALLSFSTSPYMNSNQCNVMQWNGTTTSDPSITLFRWSDHSLSLFGLKYSPKFPCTGRNVRAAKSVKGKIVRIAVGIGEGAY